MSTPLTDVGGRLAVPVDDDDHIRGPKEAPVTLVEYGDFQCPYCGAAYPVVEQLLRLRPDAVRLVFRHFPLTNVHPYAETAAETAEAAGVRQKFWPMHDWLFEHQDELNPLSMFAAAKELGLDDEAIAAEVRDRRHLNRVRSDFVGGVHSGVNGTPTFFVNGLRHDGGYSLPELLSVVDEAAF